MSLQNVVLPTIELVMKKQSQVRIWKSEKSFEHYGRIFKPTIFKLYVSTQQDRQC